MGMREKLPLIDELSEGMEKAYIEPISVVGEGIKDGIGKAQKDVESRQRKIRAKRTRVENFIVTIASSAAGLLGAYFIFILNEHIMAGFVFLIIGLIISLLPPLTPKEAS